jgi:hypothetical protein
MTDSVLISQIRGNPALHGAGVCHPAEASRLDQVQMSAGIGAQANNAAGVRGISG